MPASQSTPKKGAKSTAKSDKKIAPQEAEKEREEAGQAKLVDRESSVQDDAAFLQQTIHEKGTIPMKAGFMNTGMSIPLFMVTVFFIFACFESSRFPPHPDNS